MTQSKHTQETGGASGEHICELATTLGWHPSPMDRSWSSPHNQEAAKQYLAALAAQGTKEKP